MGFNTNEAKSFEDMANEQENAAEVTATEAVTTEAGDKPCDCTDETCGDACKDEKCGCNTETTKTE